MLYCIAQVSKGNKHENYGVYNTVTNHRFNMSGRVLLKLMKKGIPVANMHIGEDGIEHLNQWPHDLFMKKGPESYVFLRQCDEYYYLIVDYFGEKQMVNEDYLCEMIDKDMVYNCSVRIVNGKKYYESIDTDKTDYTVSKQFEAYIHEQYNKFIAKSALVGLDCRFEYDIVGTEVVYLKILGNANYMVIPGFVTTIGTDCTVLNASAIDKLTILSGVKFIENRAFSFGCIKEAYIPKSVQFIGRDAFFGCDSLVCNKGYNFNNLHLESKATILG